MLNALRRFWDWIVLDVAGMVTWEWLAARRNHGPYYRLTMADHFNLQLMLAKDHYLIVTRRDPHLSTHLQGFIGWVMTGRWAFWSHALLNAEDEVTTDTDFRLIEATRAGVHYSTFFEVFDCDAAALLMPKGFTPEQWTAALTDAAKQVGKPYDTVFDCLDDSRLSCIELVRHALQTVPDYASRFARFEGMLRRYKTLTPEMLYQCEDFKVILEIRR
jgi:hypothetical protein